MSQGSQQVELQTAGGSLPPPLLTRTRVLGGLAVYFLLHVLWRVLVSDSVELDESEQVISAQSWSWGYAQQPPLYTWLQKLMFAVTGMNVFSLVACKCLLLFATYYFVYRAAKEIWGEGERALLSALCLFFIPQIAWESQRDLTHSVLATASAAATLFIFLKLAKTGHATWYAALGLIAGVGLLSKLNYMVFLLALMLAAISLPGPRRRILNPRLLLSAAILLLVAGPHLAWLSGQAKAQNALTQLTFSSAEGLFKAYLAGTGSLLQSLIYFAGPMAFLSLFLFLQRPAGWGNNPIENQRSQPVEPVTEPMKLLYRTVLAVLVICVLALVCFRAQFKARWLQPLLFMLPLSLLLLARARLSAQKIRLLSALACLAALAILLIMPAIPLAASVTQRTTRLNAPWAELSRQLKKKMPGFSPGVILADSCLPGGNLKMHFPESLALAPECKVIPPPRNVPWLLVWEAEGDGRPSAAFEQFVSGLRGAPLAGYKPNYIEAPSKYCPSERMKLGYLVLSPANE